MKKIYKILVSMLVVTVMFGCSSSKSDAPAPTKTATEIWEYLSTGEFDKLTSYMDANEDFSFEDLMSDEGFAEYADVFENIMLILLGGEISNMKENIVDDLAIVTFDVQTPDMENFITELFTSALSFSMSNPEATEDEQEAMVMDFFKTYEPTYADETVKITMQFDLNGDKWICSNITGLDSLTDSFGDMYQ